VYWAELRDLALGSLDELAPSSKKIAVCLYGPCVYAPPGTYRGFDVLVVCDDYPHGLRAHRKIEGKDEVRYLMVDRPLIESDVDKGAVGDFLTERLLYPYRSATNYEYLDNLGARATARVVKEEIRELILEYGEMCREIVAKPEYFILSRLRKRSRVFLPSMDEYLRLLEPSVREQNVMHLREAFAKVVSSIGSEWVEFDGENVLISDAAVDRWLKSRVSGQVVNILNQSRRAFYSYLARGRAIYLDLDLLARELYNPLRLGLNPRLAGREPEDPKNHLYLRTAERLVPLNERFSLEELVARLGHDRPIIISPLAGVLNEVFLVTSGQKRYVAKKFTDWHRFKWFTLNLVSFGSKLFSVSGKARMSNEYGINRYLARKGLNVPRIVYANVKERILIEDYVSGRPLNEIVTQIVNKPDLTESEQEAAEALGLTLGRIHEVGVSVGDSKPENFVATDRDIFAVDLEQAGRKGDYAWDIAEMLFYTGHYSSWPTPSRGLSKFVDAFIHGYLQHGKSGELNRAAGVRYAKSFSLWTPAPIILEISKKLRAASSKS